MGKLGKLAGALSVMGALASPTAAQETNNDGVVLASAEGTVRTVEECLQARRDGEFGRAGFRECKEAANQAIIADQEATIANQETTLADQEATIANQEQILAALNTELAEIGLRLDDQGRILDEQGQELASIVAINGQLVIRIQQTQEQRAALNADSEEQLRHVEQVLQRLATS